MRKVLNTGNKLEQINRSGCINTYTHSCEVDTHNFVQAVEADAHPTSIAVVGACGHRASK
jgi:hypothetical protein